MSESHDYLRRLPPEAYRGHAYVHWTLTIEDRKTNWRTPIAYYKFRELLTHAASRYGVCCPIYCVMPDHIHMLWLGMFAESDQRVAMRFLRLQMQPVLENYGAEFQRQPYDHVLAENERLEDGVIALVEYIARNPERKGLVAADGYRDYPYTGCLVPGYPSLRPFQPGYWELFWRILSGIRKRDSVMIAVGDNDKER